MTIIKRYSNRKLYNTAQKKYITLDELAILIRTGEEIQVIDNQSGEDLTSLTLTQIILESEKKHQGSLSNSILTDIIKRGSDELKTLSEFFPLPPHFFQFFGDQVNQIVPTKKDLDDLSSQIDVLSEKLDSLSSKSKK